MLIYLIRHAETQISPTEPAAIWPLTERGRQQAEAIAALPFWPAVRAIYSSPEEKALATVAPAAERYGLPVTPIAGLAELERPAGLVPDYLGAVAACFAEPDRSVNGWEPAAQVQRRMLAALQQLPGDGPVAIASHGLAFALLLAGLAGRPVPTLPEWRAILMPGYALLDRSTGRLVAEFAPVPLPV